MSSAHSRNKDRTLFPLSTVTYLEQLHSLWTRKALCDAVVIADDRKFEVHRVVLAAASKYFERVFGSDNWVECKTGQVALDGISALSLEIILNSVYTQELQLSPEIVLGVLEAAHRLEFTEVFKCCERYMEDIVAPPNCLDYLLAGETYNMAKVLQSSEKCLLENFSVVSLQDRFLAMSCDAVKNYIRSSALQCESEMDVFHAVVRWLKHDELRKNKAITLMRHVRFGLMTTSHLLGDVWKEPIMISNEACQEMLRKAIEYCSKPNEQPFVKEEWCTPRNTKSWLVVIGGQWNPTKAMTPPVVMPFEDPRKESWSLDENLKPLSNTYQYGGAAVVLHQYLFMTGGAHTYPASSNDSLNEAHSSSSGKNTVSNAAWRFNSVTLKCEQMTNMIVARKYHVAFLYKETILVAGGKNDSKKSLSSTEIYTIKNNSWELGPYMPNSLMLLAGCSYKEQAYISGGLMVKKHKEVSSKKFYKYDLTLNEWIQKAPMSSERCEHVMCSTSAGIYVVGGAQIYRPSSERASTTINHITKPEFYDTAKDQWTVLRLDKLDLRVCKPSVVVQAEKIYVLGGLVYEDPDSYPNNRMVNTIKCLNTQTNTMSKVSARLPFQIMDAIMAVMPLPSNKEEEYSPDRHDGYDDYLSIDDNDDDERSNTAYTDTGRSATDSYRSPHSSPETNSDSFSEDTWHGSDVDVESIDD